MSFNPVQIRELRIAGSGISATDTSITFRKMVLVDTDETPVTMAMFGTIGYITIEPRTDREENISFTGITQNANGTATITGVTRGLEPDTPYAENSDFKFPHAGGAIAVVSNSSVYYSQFGKLANDEEITGYWEAPNPLTAQGLVTRDYMLGLINGGNITTNKVIVAGTAGETVAAGNLVYFNETDNEWKKTDADTAATVNLVLLGIAQGAGVDGGAISGGVLLWGLDENQSGMSQGDLQYASNTAGGISNTTGTVEKIIGIARNATTLYFDPDFYYRLTIDQKNAIAGGSTFGTPSSTNKFITQDYNSSATGLPVVRTYTTVSSAIGGSTTQFDITNPSGTTFRYTWDSTGTDPGISLANNPVGSLINFQAQNFNSANNGLFVVTGAGSNYVEVTNASGVVESNKTIGTGYVVKSGTSTWTKPTGLKYVTVELVGGGGDGGNGYDDGTSGGSGGGGGAGGYSKKLIQASSLSSSEYYIVGDANRLSAFGSHLYATGGSDGGNYQTDDGFGGLGGSGFNGDINIVGGDGSPGIETSTTNVMSGGNGGQSQLGGSARGANTSASAGDNGNLYGSGAGGGAGGGAGASNGGTGAQGIVILTEYFS